MISVVIFTSKLFLPSLTHTSLSHTHCLCQAFTAPTHTPSQTERSTPTHHDRDLAGHRNCAIDVDHDRDCADRRRSRSSKSARLRSRSRRSRAKLRSPLRAIAIAILLAIEIGEIAIAISPIEIAPIAIAIAISPRKYAVLLGFI